MKKLIPLIMVASVSALATPVKADITSRMSSSVQLNVNAAATQVERIGSTYSISGSGVNTTDGTTAGTISTGAITSGVMAPGAISATQASNGNAFSYSQSYTQADAVPTSAPSTGAVPNFSSVTSTSAGTAGDLAGTLTTGGAMTITAGGAGTSATSQFVTEITVK
tara:strand:+ start:2101 stop:2598 length:498 start_codon:yes stop_codon:yes gene_type:complete